jgi:hypothetical protein
MSSPLNNISANLLASFGTTGSEPSTVNQLSPDQKAEMSSQVSSYVNSSGVDLNVGNWIALTDTISDVRTVTLAQVEEGLLEQIVGKLGELKNVVAGFDGLTEGSQEYDLAMAEFDALEAEVSSLIGLSTIKVSATMVADPDTGDIELKNVGSYVDALRLTGKDGVSTDIAMIEISQNDFLGGYHFPDACPICSAEREAALSSGSENTSQEIPANGPSTVSGNVTGFNYNNSLSGTSIVDTLDSFYRWDISADETLTYSFYDDTVGLSYANWTPYELGADREAELRVAYETWDLYLPFEMEEVEESGTTVGELRSMYNDLNSYGAAGSAAQGAYPFNDAAAGDSYFHLLYDSPGVLSASQGGLANNLDFAPGTYGFFTALHEYGHNLGIRHPFGNTDAGGNLPTAEEDHRYSIMAYSSVDDLKVTFSGNSSSYSYSATSINPITPMVYDLMAVHDWYGLPTDSNTGNTTFTYTDPDEIQTLIDSGGTDTIDVSGMEQRSIIDLTPGAYSSIGYWSMADQVSYWASTIGIASSTVQGYFDTYDTISSSGPNISGGYTRSGGVYERQSNLGIAEGTIIENVIGSNGDDNITGNTADNEITGGQGNDVIDGGAGTDKAIFAGAYAEYTITDNGDGTYTVADSQSGRDGSDTISNVERFTFSDSFYDVSSGGQMGGVNYRGGSNGGGKSNVYYSAFNRVDLSRTVIPKHQLAQLKQLLFNSVGDVSDLLEEALKNFAAQKSSMSMVLTTIESGVSGALTANPDSTTPILAQKPETQLTSLELVAQLKSQILKDLNSAVSGQSNASPTDVANILST